MGCAYSQNTCDNETMVFEAVNIDISHNPITDGKIMVNKTEISFTYNNDSEVLVWPLKSLRRYGYDEQEFSFEAGRRCPSGPGIYGFKCEKADQLFYLVQQNIQVCTNNSYERNTSHDRMIRNLWNDSNACRPITRVTIPTESNYLDPTPVRNSALHFSHSVHDRLSSIGSSSGPMSPQGTMGTPSPPPTIPSSLPPPLPNLHTHPFSYVNKENSQVVSPGDSESNNNKSLERRSMQRSHTVSSSTSSSVFLSSEQVSGQLISNEVWTTSQSGAAVPSQSSVPSYMNVDLGSDASPLSPSYSTCDSSAPLKKEPSDSLDAGNSSIHAYINISPESEKLELMLPTAASKPRPPALPIASIQFDPDEDVMHSYANLGTTEIEALKKRCSVVSVSYGVPIQVTTPPPHSSGYREVRYAILNLDKKDPSLVPATTPVKASSSLAATPTTNEPTADSHKSTPDSTTKARQNSYATIDFDKTNALSHSVNSNNKYSSIIPDEGSRKTRHNSTISELMIS